jgi:AraC-like DNA-binding protein
MSIGMQTVLNQIFNYNKKSTTKKLFLKSKLYELISQIFDSNNEVSIDQCPVFINSEYFKKIRLAKEILISNFSSPPTLEKLSDEVGLSLKKLKIGFKEVYGKPAYQYLIDYKMEIAKNMITNGKLNINEISDELGYNNASHFISSFKKKFGITPKSFLSS